MKGKELIRKIWDEYKTWNFYEPSDEIAPVKRQVQGTAFFPAGEGLYENSNEMIDILVLGQDFGTVEYYNRIIENENVRDTDCATWKNMIKLFETSGIDLKRCFFSNVFMGLRKKERMIGALINSSPKYADYRNQNIEFLKRQISIVAPKAIIALGHEPIKLLKNVVKIENEEWNSMAKVSDISSIVKITISEGFCYCVALNHPSMRNSNKRFRRYEIWNNENCNDVEVEMLKDLLKKID